MNTVNDTKTSGGEKIWGIVPAAGIGKRMMSERPKQYLGVPGRGSRRVLDWALDALCQSDSVDGVVVGIRDGDRWWRAEPFVHAKLLAVSAGGDCRARTVRNALARLLQDGIAAADDWALVHDGVRPCLAGADIERLVAAARAHGGGAVLTTRLADTVKRGSGGVIQETLCAHGSVHWRALTPQLFRCRPLEAALREALARGVTPTDESAAMEMTGMRPAAVEGHPANIKITVPADLELAACYLRGKNP